MVQARTMTAAEAAAHLGVGLSTVYEMFDRGEVAGYRVRRRVVLYRTSVEGLERAGRNAARAAAPAGPQRPPLLRPPPGLFRD